jgi:predicted DNA-binding transcriptional regulator AlpA
MYTTAIMQLSFDDGQERLESWKEIADYLKKSVSTVQRWERQEGLPVRRHEHLKLGSVVAYKRELDAWMQARLSSPPVIVPGSIGDPSAERQHRATELENTASLGCLARGGPGSRVA